MIASGQPFLATNPWLVFVPAIVLLLTVLSFYTLGDYGRRHLDVRRWKLRYTSPSGMAPQFRQRGEQTDANSGDACREDGS